MVITLNVYSHYKTVMPNQTVLLRSWQHFLGWSYVSSPKLMLSNSLNLKEHYQALLLHYLELEMIRNVDKSTQMCVSEWTFQLVPSATDLYLIIYCSFSNIPYVWKSKSLENTTLSENANYIKCSYKISKNLCLIKQFNCGGDITF
jgi:hypothetical protein